MLCGAPSCSEACLFFSNDLLRLWLQSVQYDLQHGFAWVTDEADCSVVISLLQIAFLWKCDDRGLGPRNWLFSCPPDCHESGDYVLSTCLTSSAGILSTPADFPFFSDCTAASASLRMTGWLSSVCVWGQFTRPTDRPPLAL